MKDYKKVVASAKKFCRKKQESSKPLELAESNPKKQNSIMYTQQNTDMENFPDKLPDTTTAIQKCIAVRLCII